MESVLTHRMSRTYEQERSSAEAIRQHHREPLRFAEDLDYLPQPMKSRVSQGN
jgi:hypothetical protein